MIGGPWDVILTLLFAVTAAICVWDFARRSDRSDTMARIDIGHVIMSIAMIAMIWTSQSNLVMWLQVFVFAVLLFGLIGPMGAATDPTVRTDILTHIVLYAAMIWMLAAMEMLMAGMSSSSPAMPHHAGMSMDMGSETPTWASVVNWVFVGLSGLVAIWWGRRLIAVRGADRVHALCHVLMAVGMAVMLVLMANG